ncbi:MAG: hypothetical protein Q4F80_03870, partial [bacterium]|nr:hypothetical protein [bacterium]
MSSNELPSNMGKKIADALKKQNKAVKEASVDVVEEVQDHTDDFEDVISDLHSDTHEYKTDIDSIIESDDVKESPYDDLDLYDT